MLIKLFSIYFHIRINITSSIIWLLSWLSNLNIFVFIKKNIYYNTSFRSGLNFLSTLLPKVSTIYLSSAVSHTNNSPYEFPLAKTQGSSS